MNKAPLLAIVLSLHFACELVLPTAASAQGTAFVYQGRLDSGGAPANGLYDFRFKLYSDPLGNTQAGSSYLTNGIGVTNGLFLTTVDFGAGIFTGAGRWLEVDVMTNGGGAYAVLAPLQAVQASPYSVFAGNAGNLSGTVAASQVTGSLPVSQVSGTVPLAQLPAVVLTNGDSGVSLTGTFTGNAGGLTNVLLSAVGPAGTFSLLPVFFAPASTYPVGAGPRSVAVADVNGDGLPDLICANSGANSLTVLTNNGNGVFVFSATLAVGSGPVSVVAVTNVDGHGGVALVSANAGTNTLTEWTNSGGGSFSLAATYTVSDTTNAPKCVVTADVNGDGKPDLICVNSDLGPNYEYTTLSVLTNNGSGSFVLNPPITVPSYGEICLTTADVNGDGKPDVILSSFLIGVLTVLTNNGAGSFGSYYYGGGSGLLDQNGVHYIPTWVAAANINGRTALIISSDLGYSYATSAFITTNVVAVLTNNGTGVFSYNDIIAVGNTPEGVAVADVNNDGKPDLISANSGDNSLSVLTNNGSGVFGYALTVSPGGNPVFVTAANVLGDPKPDLITANSGGTVSVVPNDSPAITAAGDFAGNFNGSFSGSGSGLTGLNAANLTGTLPAAVIPSNLNLAVSSLNVDPLNQNPGVIGANALTFGLSSGEGMASKRSGVNPYDLEFYTDFANRMTILQNGNVGIGTTNPQAALQVAGPVLASGLIRLGSETGAAAPYYPDATGMLIRRVASLVQAVDNIVARTDTLTLERDGTAGGLLVRWTAAPGVCQINATGVTTNGTLAAFHYALSNPSTTGTVTVFSASQNVSHYDISFGDTYNAQHLTHAVLDRYDTDYYMVGTVISSYNQ